MNAKLLFAPITIRASAIVWTVIWKINSNGVSLVFWRCWLHEEIVVGGRSFLDVLFYWNIHCSFHGLALFVWVDRSLSRSLIVLKCILTHWMKTTLSLNIAQLLLKKLYTSKRKALKYKKKVHSVQNFILILGLPTVCTAIIAFTFYLLMAFFAKVDWPQCIFVDLFCSFAIFIRFYFDIASWKFDSTLF